MSFQSPFLTYFKLPLILPLILANRVYSVNVLRFDTYHSWIKTTVLVVSASLMLAQTTSRRTSLGPRCLHLRPPHCIVHHAALWERRSHHLWTVLAGCREAVATTLPPTPITHFRSAADYRRSSACLWKLKPGPSYAPRSGYVHCTSMMLHLCLLVRASCPTAPRPTGLLQPPSPATPRRLVRLP